MALALRDVFARIASDYTDARQKPFASNPLAQFIRDEAADAVKALLPDEGLLVRGSAGQGQFAEIPWIAVLNKLETDGPQEGVYVVYLFSADLAKLYLTLAQGVTRPIELHGRKGAFIRLQAKAADVRANFSIAGFDDYAKVDLAAGDQGSAYEKSVIYAKEYSTAGLPPEETLKEDLLRLVSFYNRYLEESDVLTAEVDFSAAIGRVEEGKRLLKQHYVRERNPAIIKLAKKLGLAKLGELRCEVCNFSFPETYGERTSLYIEGHHRKAVSEMAEGDKTAVEDIALVCSNCHRAIHAKWPYISVEELKSLFERLKK